MRKAVCPGSFDPVTNGHLDIIGRAAALFDEVTVMVAYNGSKAGLFTVDERIEMLHEVTAGVAQRASSTASAACSSTSAATAASRPWSRACGRSSDFDYELQMAQMNRQLGGVETLFVPTSATYSYLSSSLLKEVAALGGDVAGLVPDVVATRLRERLASR